MSITNTTILVKSSTKMVYTNRSFSLNNFAGTPNWLKLFPRKHHSGVVSNLELIPQTQQNENKIAYDCKTNENLNEQQISFPMSKTMRKVTAKTTFRYIHTYPSLKCEFLLLSSQTEINRTPRVFYNNFKTKQTLNPNCREQVKCLIKYRT